MLPTTLLNAAEMGKACTQQRQILLRWETDDLREEREDLPACLVDRTLHSGSGRIECSGHNAIRGTTGQPKEEDQCLNHRSPAMVRGCARMRSSALNDGLESRKSGLRSRSLSKYSAECGTVSLSRQYCLGFADKGKKNLFK